MKPPINYYGGKARLAPWIVSWFPEHQVYIEPFAGSAAVLFAKTACTHELINDVDGEVVNFFKVLRERTEELERACRLTPYARDEFMAARHRGGELGDLERARRWWVRLTQSHSCLVTPWASFSVSTKRGSNKASTGRALVERMEAAAERLAGVTIENRDALEIIDHHARPNGRGGAVLYVDPPYPLEVRRMRLNRKSKEYQVDMSAEADHRRLAEVLRATPATVFLSGYPGPLYDELYPDWHQVRIEVAVPSANLSGRSLRATEVLWSNQPIGGQMELGS